MCGLTRSLALKYEHEAYPVEEDSDEEMALRTLGRRGPEERPREEGDTPAGRRRRLNEANGPEELPWVWRPEFERPPPHPPQVGGAQIPVQIRRAVEGENAAHYAPGGAPRQLARPSLDSDDEMPLDELMAQAREREAQAIYIRPAVRAAVKRVHNNLGHPGNRTLIRALVIANATEEAIEAARTLTCEICARLQRARPRRPAQLPRARHFGEHVAVDLFVLKDIDDEVFTFLNVVDLATRFQVVTLVASKRPDDVLAGFENAWSNWAGAPENLQADAGGEFYREFAEFLEAHGSQLHFSGVEAPWQNGTCERHGAVWKIAARHVIMELSVRGISKMRSMTATVNWAKNSRVNASGFSPSQWVLGRSMRLPWGLLDGAGRLAEQSAAAEEPTFAARLGMLTAARNTFETLDTSQRIRRAWLARGRTLNESTLFPVGTVVYFTRVQKPSGPRGRKTRVDLFNPRYFGPAVVVGQEGSNVWISHRNRLTKCAAEHVRRATNEELLSFKALPRDQESLNLLMNDARRPIDYEDLTRGAAMTMLDNLTPEELRDAHLQDPLEADLDREVRSRTRAPVEGETAGPRAATDSAGTGGAAPGPGPARTHGPEPRPWTREEDANYFAPDPNSRGSGLTTDEKVTAEVPRRGRSRSPRGRRSRSPSAQTARSRSSSSSSSPGTAGEGRSRKRDESDPATEASKRLRAQSQGVKRQPEGGDAEDPGQKRLREALTVAHETAHDESVRNLRRCLRGMTPSPTTRLEQLKEACAATARRELQWSSIPEHVRPLYTKAVEKQWASWLDNGAVEFVAPAEAREIEHELAEKGDSSRVMDMRYVFTDKNDGKRTPHNDLPVHASCRIVIPGYSDPDLCSLRRDAPTLSRAGRSLFLLIASAKEHKHWRISSSDIEAAFLKGEKYDRVLYGRPPRRGPPLPGSVPGSLFRILKGVFGLNDAPRKWWLRLKQFLLNNGCRQSLVDPALFILEIERQLRGIIGPHVDDLLAAGDEAMDQLLEKVDKEFNLNSAPRSTTPSGTAASTYARTRTRARSSSAWPTTSPTWR